MTDIDAQAEGSRDKTVKGMKAEASPDSPAEIWTRRSILAAFWAVVVFLGFPHWLWTTSVYRAELDVDAAGRWINGEGCDMQYKFNIVVKSDGDATARQRFVQDLSAMPGTDPDSSMYRYEVADSSRWTAPLNEADLVIEIAQASTMSLRYQGSVLEIGCPAFNTDTMPNACALGAAESIQDFTSQEKTALAFLAKDTAYAQRLQHPLTKTAELEKATTRAFKYASSYHLTFSLFTATSVPSSWAIESALQQYIQPLLQTLSSISNFTVDTQVQYYASFSPSMTGPHYDDASKSWQLDQTDLSGFINAAEWPLNPSIDAGPTMNFVLYVPSPEQSPLNIPNSATNSWIVPQWGGVQILNMPGTTRLSTEDLTPVMYTFADQLTALLGLAKQPGLLQLRIKALTRQRVASLIISASETLGALIRLTEKLEQIAIPRSVAHAVSSSVADLELACNALHNGQHKAALLHAQRADEAVEKAFFEPSMVGQVYFPDEHKVAVYVPLLGPMAVPLLMATIKEFRQWRQRKTKTS